MYALHPIVLKVGPASSSTVQVVPAVPEITEKVEEQQKAEQQAVAEQQQAEQEKAEQQAKEQQQQLEELHGASAH